MNNVTMDRTRPIAAVAKNEQNDKTYTTIRNIPMKSKSPPAMGLMVNHKAAGTHKSALPNVAMPTTSAMIDTILLISLPQSFLRKCGLSFLAFHKFTLNIC